MIELARFKKRVSKNRRTYYEGQMGTGQLLLFRNFEKKGEDDHDLTLYIVPVKKKAQARDG